MQYKILNTRTFRPWWEKYLGPIMDNPEPEIWDDAEIDMRREAQQRPDKSWWLAVAEGTGEVLAWCACWSTGRTIDGEVLDLECGHNYERRGLGRALGAYRDVFAERQDWIRMHQLSAVTYIFDQPVALHEAAGWTRTGRHDVSEHGHHWQELVYRP